MDEINLIQRCKENDMDAFNDLYKKYSNKALRTAYLICGRNNIAEDVVQEAFIKCYKEIKNLKNPETFQSWFYRLLTRIAWRCCLKEKNHLYIESMDDNKDTVTDSLVLSDIAEKREIKQLVGNAINKLSVPLKTTVILYYYNELSIKEISKVLGCFQGTVKSRLYNARKLLEKGLSTKEFEDYFLTDKNIRRESDEKTRPSTI
ncbi:RNA polymerase sigma factor [Clostridium estertheticum]|uniref:RNA polymerase sigma factor n=1 Tax=Clostridium estertheticum TaxID=238834 RepID=UPI001CF24866|nr:RNA polymerase sigma factor [Clostridium estertheticum]MCB2342939.1 RNA polymerase sigma factor [Clostridium estertheticum]